MMNNVVSFFPKELPENRVLLYFLFNRFPLRANFLTYSLIDARFRVDLKKVN